jgi:hypothetical protein
MRILVARFTTEEEKKIGAGGLKQTILQKGTKKRKL